MELAGVHIPEQDVREVTLLAGRDEVALAWERDARAEVIMATHENLLLCDERRNLINPFGHNNVLIRHATPIYKFASLRAVRTYSF